MKLNKTKKRKQNIHTQKHKMKRSFRRRGIKRSKYHKKGGGYRTLKTGDKYSDKTDAEIMHDCSLTDQSALSAIIPPFAEDNEIYIWINNRCRRNISELSETDPNNGRVKIKAELLISIWGHCAFSFDPNNGPIYGYSVNIDDLYEKYISREVVKSKDYTDDLGYLNFDSSKIFNEFIQEFETKSYTGNNPQSMFPGVLHVDTEIFKAVTNLPGCEIHRFTLFTKSKETDSTIQNYITVNNGFVEDSVYGIYKNSDKCYGSVDDKNIYNCITYVINRFKPYFYEKKMIGNKCIFSKTDMDTLGKYCGSLGMIIEKLKTTVGAKVFNSLTDKEELPLCLGGDKIN